MPDAAQKPLPQIYREWVSTSIDETGIEIPNALALDASGELSVYALALPTADAYGVMLRELASKQPVEMIFAFDRFAKPGQGTTLGDLMAGHHFVGRTPRPFIIEYQHDPRVVNPIDWDNEFWNAALQQELLGVSRQLMGRG